MPPSPKIAARWRLTSPPLLLQESAKHCNQALEIGYKGTDAIRTKQEEAENPDIVTIEDDVKLDIDLVKHSIWLLHKLRPGIWRDIAESPYLQGYKSYRIQDDEGNDVESTLVDVFSNYISGRFSSISDILRQRLGRTMVLRRRKILDRRSRYGNSPIKVAMPTPEPELEESQSQPQGTANREVSKQAVEDITTLDNHEEIMFPPRPAALPGTRYEVPLFPKAWDKIPTTSCETTPGVACPFCLYVIPSVSVDNDVKWRSHVLNDIEPYVCVFDDCDKPE
ncbi:hypothetical protein EDB81DRAFT_883614 [Dactylonectria macrodidyma]|uniref:Uncharacterized protein n=1 Tax=Dactylonectria macrodidyma TaxID=307937 RepID=A0A9P9J3Y3_9HYPO|nr:hypothetical protein EDB81DRAFT_883614 [Dactylonectria macrodidyma]